MRRFADWFLVCCLAIAAASCAALNLDDPSFDKKPGVTPVEPDGGASNPGAGPSDALPTIRITAPQSGAAIATDILRIEGEAGDDRSLASVLVKVGPNVPLLARTSDGFRHWWVESTVPQGMFLIEANARDGNGQTSDPDRVTVLGSSGSGSDDASPNVTIASPADGSAPLQAQVLVRGTANDDRAVVSMEVLRDGELLQERAIETDNFFASWSRLVPLIPGVKNELTFVARDDAGHEGRATITLFGRAEIDRAPPALTITSPADLTTLNSAELTVTGTAFDLVGLREVKLRIGRTPAGSTTRVWSEYEAVATTDGFATWAKTVTIPIGAFSLEARAIDLNGLGTSVLLELSNAFIPEWTDEVSIPLRLNDGAPVPTIRFELDEKGVNEVIAEDIQRDTVVLELQTTALLNNAVNQIKDSCGTRWRENNANPRHDCSLTELGRSYGSNWQSSPEYSFVRLLTMTPKNSVVDGTSVQNLKSVANNLRVGGGFSEILGHTFGIPVTQEIVSTPGAVKALQDFWMASHPEVLPNAKLPITLYDAMQDFASLKERFGPKGGHPGLLDPSFTPNSVVFGPDFQLELEATSNLRWMDGVDLSGKQPGQPARAAKDYIALVVDTAGPTFDDVLEFDFTSPAKFDVVGLTERPTVDLRMSMFENNTFVRSCVLANDTCKNNLPNAPAPGYLWANPSWQVESIVGAAAYYDYRNRNNYSRTYNLLFIPSATVTVGNGSDRAGWSTYWTLLNIGSPPPDQYLWELILEVGQVALHRFGDTTLPEGNANVRFTLYDVDVGLSADDIRAAMRPTLQAQRHTLSDRLLGDYEKNNGAVDFFYRRGADNKPYLFFVAESDPRPISAYNYDQPGFFADAELTTKLSDTAPGASGDRVHEKLSLSKGETIVYVRDDVAAVYRLRFVVGDDAQEIRVFASQQVR